MPVITIAVSVELAGIALGVSKLVLGPLAVKRRAAQRHGGRVFHRDACGARDGQLRIRDGSRQRVRAYWSSPAP